MNEVFRIILIVGIFVYIVVLAILMKKQKLNLRYTLVWLLMAVVMLIVSIFPQIAIWLAQIMGIASVVNMVFLLEGLFVLLILLSLTSIVSLQTNRIRRLTQTQALLERRVRELEKAVNVHGEPPKEI